MYAVNFQNTLSELRRQSPFRPFVVEFVNGERIEVDHPETLAIRDKRAIFINKGGGAHYFDPEGVSRIIGKWSRVNRGSGSGLRSPGETHAVPLMRKRRSPFQRA
jgi:hypothetical protein